MKGSLALLDHLHGRKVAARMENGRLEDLLIDGPEDGPPPPGTLYRARVDRPAKGQGGAFVSLPDGSGFLRDGKGLAPGEPLLCQVTGYAEPGKAIPVTSRVLFKSKLAIVTPGAPGLNISRSIRDQEQRVRLRAVAESLDVPEGVGVILRSNAAEADDDAVEDDIAEMLTLASGLAEEVKGPPERLLDGPDAHHLAWREWGAPDSVETATGCLEDHGVLDELDALRGPQAALKGGGSLFVEPTRALIAVDVNTGNNFSTGASLKANIEASRDLP
ncbi:MAG: ribonuclease E/G, partial [Pseudomonadota bacterium]